MKCYQFVFSPTGGTKRVADALTQSWPQPESIDLSAPDAREAVPVCEADGLALIAMPSFGGVAPRLALERLASIRGNGARCVIAAVYGNRAYEDTLVQMADYAEKAGFRVIAAVSAVAEHSIVHQYAAGRPDETDRRELGEFGARILEKAGRGELSTPAIPGNRPYKSAGGGMIPRADASCTGCGLCARRCPTGAIAAENPRATDKGKCISCMRCVSECPAKARKVSGLMTSIAALAIKKACSVRKANELFL